VVELLGCGVGGGEGEGRGERGDRGGMEGRWRWRGGIGGRDGGERGDRGEGWRGGVGGWMEGRGLVERFGGWRGVWKAWYGIEGCRGFLRFGVFGKDRFWLY